MKTLEFEALKEVVKLITKNKTKQLDVIGYGNQGDSLIDQLYEGISKDKFDDDDQAAESLFESHAKDPKYKRLRYRFPATGECRLFIDAQESLFADQRRAIVSCYRDYAAAQILLGRSANKAGIFLLQQVLEQSTKYELTALNADITRSLRRQYGTILNDLIAYEKIVEQNRQFEKMRAAEILAYDYYDVLSKHYLVHQTPNTEVHNIASKYYDELLAYKKDVDTAEFHYYTFMVGMIKYSSTADYESAYTITKMALEQLKDRISMNRGRIYGIALQEIFCITQLKIRDEELANKAFDYCLSLTDPDRYNWFKVLETKCYYLLHAERYQDAFEVYKEVFESPERNNLTGVTRDSIKLLEAYLHLLAKLSKIDAKKMQDLVGPFNWQEFMTPFEVVDRDREGLNIPLLQLPILISIAEGDYDNYGRSVEALDKYRQRYMETELNKRSACFLKMLMALAKWNYEQDASERKIQRELETMQALKPDNNRQMFFVEVIPYEQLWPIMYEHVTRQKA
ncbi:MAG: hypothetical protein IPL65_18955 [Lewinellaceae bacterium]|nr:hypothetical protein [Lewinellaceae bacterium]